MEKLPTSTLTLDEVRKWKRWAANLIAEKGEVQYAWVYTRLEKMEKNLMDTDPVSKARAYLAGLKGDLFLLSPIRPANRSQSRHFANNSTNYSSGTHGRSRERETKSDKPVADAIACLVCQRRPSNAQCRIHLRGTCNTGVRVLMPILKVDLHSRATPTRFKKNSGQIPENSGQIRVGA
jgi:hypothetical protein